MAVKEMDKASMENVREGVTVTFPSALLVASQEEPGQFHRRVVMSTLGPLYEQGKISSGFAAKILGCDRREFYQLLTQYGFLVIDYAEDDREYEAATSRKLAVQIKQK
jgi:hypothetical protein